MIPIYTLVATYQGLNDLAADCEAGSADSATFIEARDSATLIEARRLIEDQLRLRESELSDFMEMVMPFDELLKEIRDAAAEND